MQKPPRSRMMLFLLMIVVLVAIVRGWIPLPFMETSSQPPPKARVSRMDIRRGIGLSFASAMEMLNNDMSFGEQFARKNVNSITVDIPLIVRSGNPAYLEYSNLLMNELERLIDRIHLMGMEVALNPQFVGNTEILNDTHAASAVYTMYEEFLLDASLSRADVIFIIPPQIQTAVPASDVLRTIQSMYDSFSGLLYLQISMSDTAAVSMYRNHVRGFVVHETAEPDPSRPISIPQSHDEGTEYIFDVRSLNDIDVWYFQPYIEHNANASQIDIEQLVLRYTALEYEPWFRGVILPSAGDISSDGKFSQREYNNALGEWYKYLKKVSQQRAFQFKEGTLK